MARDLELSELSARASRFANPTPDQYVCDFCTSNDVRWDYPAVTFKMPYNELEPGLGPGLTTEWGSREGWAACQRCYELIEANERERLAHYVARSFVAKWKRDKSVPRAFRRTKVSEHVPHFRRLMAAFFEHRTGPPRPVTPPSAALTVPDSHHGRDSSPRA